MAISADSVKEIWARAQRKFFDKNLAMSLANREPGDALKVEGGKKFHRAILGNAAMQAYTPLTATSAQQNVSTEDEFLEISRTSHAESIHINIDDTEQVQLKNYNLEAHYGEMLGNRMKDSIEKRWVDNIDGFHTIGSTTDLKAFSGANIHDIAEEGAALVDVADVHDLTRVLVVGPREYRAIEKAAAEREAALGDQTFVNGYPARFFYDYLLVKSNNLPWSATLGLATAPSNEDSIKVAGFTVRFLSDLNDHTEGELSVLIGDAAATRANLSNLFSGGGTPGTDYVQMTITQEHYLRNNRRIAATTAADMVFTGYGDIGVSSDLTDSTDGWKNQYKNFFFTAIGATDLGLQLDEGLEVSRPKPIAGEAHFTRISGVTMHNSKTFEDGKLMTVKVFADASGY